MKIDKKQLIWKKNCLKMQFKTPKILEYLIIRKKI